MLSPLSLDNDSFDNLIEEYRSRIAGIFPEWTNYNYSDPGITFLELFAWLRENQQYFMEQLGDDHYREFFRLAGFIPRGRTCARVLAEAVPGSLRKAVLIPAGSRFLSGGLSFETTQEEFVPNAQIISAEQKDKGGNTGFFVGQGQLMYQGAFSFSPFGAKPETGASMLIRVRGGIPDGQTFRLSLMLRDSGRNPEKEGISEKLTDLSWEYLSGNVARPLRVITDETCGLLYSGRITFRMDKGLFAGGDNLQLKVTLVSGTYDIPPVITGMSLSQIELSQIQRHVWKDGLPLMEGNGFPNQVCKIPYEDFMAESLRIEVEDIWNPGKMVPWTGSDDFFTCGPEDLTFRTDESAGTICFGDGWHGMPPEGKIVLKTLTETAGSAGNIKKGAVFHPEVLSGETVQFTMMRLLSPGSDPETREETLLRIIREKNTVVRAVTLSDYERLIMATPGLCIHSCHAWTEEIDPTTVHVAVRPGDGKETVILSEQEKTIISRYLDEKRLIGMKLRLHTPSYIRVDVTVEVVPSPKYRNASEILEKEIREWFEERKSIYGKPLPYNRLLNRLDSVPCIRKLVSLSMEPRTAGISRDKNRSLIPPVNGLFLLGRIEVILNHYQVV